MPYWCQLPAVAFQVHQLIGRLLWQLVASYHDNYEAEAEASWVPLACTR